MYSQFTPNSIHIISPLQFNNQDTSTMAATYLELMAKAEKLLEEAEELRVKELDGVIADIKEKIQTYGLTAQDLGLAGAARRRKAAPAAAKKTPARYRGPNGETWAGGRGRKPRWVTEALAKGKKLEDFAIKR
jgi:DNA-binding protein H-NS